MCLAAYYTPSANYDNLALTPFGLPCNLSGAFKAQLTFERKKARMNFCGACATPGHVAMLLACKGCVGRMGLPMYYCNRSCQKKDWSLHKDECCKGYELGAPGKPVARTSRKPREGERRVRALHNVMSWATHMFHLAFPDTPLNSIIIFSFKESENHLDPWVLDRITFEQRIFKDQRFSDDMFIVPSEYAYELEFGPNKPTYMAIIEPISPEGLDYTRYIPQFPWLVAQVALQSLGDTNEWIANQKLAYLIRCLDDMPEGSLVKSCVEKFCAPQCVDEYDLWPLPALDLWRGIMGFASAF